jgi:hypothetical protein
VRALAAVPDRAHRVVGGPRLGGGSGRDAWGAGKAVDYQITSSRDAAKPRAAHADDTTPVRFRSMVHGIVHGGQLLARARFHPSSYSADQRPAVRQPARYAAQMA